MTINQMFGSSPNNEAETVTEVLPDGYKKTELGIIPTEWYVESIGNLVSITTGSKNTQDRIENGAYPFFVRSQTVERINTYSFDGEGVLTAGDGVGTGKIFHYINGKFDFHQRVYLMYNFGEKLDGFFFYKFFSNNFYDRIMSMTAKSSVDSVRREMIADMKMLVPTRHEQTAIANALSDVDALIQELEKLIAKKQAIKTATMQQLLTGRTRLPQFAHHPDGRKKGYKPSELGEIPEDWEVVQINQCTDLITKGTTPMTIGKAFVPQGITFVKVESINESGRLDFTKFAFIDEETDKLLARSRIKENDLLISIAGALGRAAIVKHEILPANTNQALAIVRLNKDSEISLNFLYHFTKTTLFKKCIDEIASQGAQPNLSLGDLGAFKIVVPNREEQKTISDMLSVIDQEIQALEQRLNKTHQIKQGMMQELLTGKTRLVKPAGAA
ncbi:restriction endonuclease subunit S [Vibrio cholerae]|uniref:restriction endonuclease subunit S n=1 Tax=Vibrio cholerae TaxID=666 RepID=UPI00247A66B9|nr:restriction endonuclease subunit S [Vibrio cholerae]ELJ8793125.1 restriction endonuclease subunit S [Vibrio cholerae]MDH7616007.1 restriction endonuclease subunit S [Vibrio cholerae]